MKVLIFGAKGYMGGRLKSVFSGSVCPPTDIADQAAVQKVLDTEKPEVVINAAGKTGRPNVDWCEDHKEETLRSNVTGPLILLEECLSRGIRLVHIGSGCIYEGGEQGSGFTEDDEPNFSGSFYSFTKAMSDRLLQPFPVLQLRLRMPFDNEENPRNLINKVEKYSKVLDVENSITYVPDFLRVTKILVQKKATGIYNVTNPGTMSPFRLMTKFQEIVNPAHRFEKLSLEGLSGVTKAGRSNCVLSTKKLESEGITLMPVEQAVDAALRAIAESRKKA
jgi:dTDP-4-dehydrorhamnose reductase